MKRIIKLLDPRKMMQDGSTSADNYQIPAAMGLMVFLAFTLLAFIVWDYGWIAFRVQSLSILAIVIPIVIYNLQ